MRKIIITTALVVVGAIIVINAQSQIIKTEVDLGGKVEPNIGLDKAVREESGKILNTVLADEYLLYTKTYNYHWNVTGLMFNDLHLFFGKQYEQIEDFIDETAERARALGVRALGSMSEFLKATRLKRRCVWSCS